MAGDIGPRLPGLNNTYTVTVLTGDITGTGKPTIATTLATVNSNVGTFQGITINSKGLVTAAVNNNYITQPTMLGLDTYTYSFAGGV